MLHEEADQRGCVNRGESAETWEEAGRVTEQGWTSAMGIAREALSREQGKGEKCLVWLR